jgi:hypothetical protein
LQVVDFCKANKVGLVMVGPEAPLVAGLADDLAAAGIRAFGPSAKAAQLEGSKAFMKVGAAAVAAAAVWRGGSAPVCAVQGRAERARALAGGAVPRGRRSWRCR